MEKLSFPMKLFSGHFYGQSFIKTVRGPFADWLLCFYCFLDVVCIAVNVLCLFVAIPWLGLKFVSVAFPPDHTHFFFLL